MLRQRSDAVAIQKQSLADESLKNIETTSKLDADCQAIDSWIEANSDIKLETLAIRSLVSITNPISEQLLRLVSAE
jgi:hypothetical protein